MRGDRFQIALIVLGIAVVCLLSYFFYKELFPEYRIYQNDYIALEKFRSTYTHEPPPAFSPGVKQIVFEREDKGPASIDRCISCHVATQLPHFSPTKIAHDANGNIKRNADGTPVQEPNENYVWMKLEEKIIALTDPKVNEQLKEQKEWGELKTRHDEAENLKALKVANVDDQIYDVTKVLRMHPLIGKETRPFEFHPIDDYGCTMCHSGNGRGLTTEKAHGPVYDGQYEIEHAGPTPQFLEKDFNNDPDFARVFNHKPSDSLLFQTTPILVGNLIQSSCVQCHAQNGITGLKKSEEKLTNDSQVNSLTTNYQRGEELFISQACYACHRIAGVARGGIGPELTREGDTYPWFLKESIVWPQADLKTSTMPNFMLDHVELEDLMTYLLAQKGQSKAVSPIAYKLNIQEWEAGRKASWEKPIPPSDIHNIDYGMTVFATEGCASCHRLEGFESSVGYRIEREAKPTFEAIAQERAWFRNMFPEDLRGSTIVKILEENSKEIDLRIVDKARQEGLLDKIDAEYPGLIESFYSNFRYATRAKNKLYQLEMDNAITPKQKETITKEEAIWKERVHRILLAYIQEYGLGRLIGPRLNWSGVYRSDQWLMEHFRNPAGHVPRSIMPIFPFDDTKFYALTYMLDVVGKRNRDAVHALWQHEGFNPALAYEMHCAQCHGDHLQGNGPVATWIYPIPKNLRNTEFMRNLTKDKAIDSIIHGIKGTPMAPWGEAPKDKENYDGIPVLSHEEATKLVNWLYKTLPGASVENLPKYQYSAAQVVNELHQEGGSLGINQTKETIDDVFRVVPNPVKGERADLYYIKKEYYTPENIEQGQRFFALNCAYCHGTDADGSGLRASIMSDAKPRMLTNLDWLKTADDLKLLRSIKYGVLGTSMTPWGDFTNSLQRLQLVMYIRSLSFDKERRDQLTEALYQVFNEKNLQIEKSRIVGYASLNAAQKEYDQIEKERTNPSISDEEALALFAKQLKLKRQLDELKKEDQLLLSKYDAVDQEQTLYASAGNALLSAGVDDHIWELFLKIIQVSDQKEQVKKMVDEINGLLEQNIKSQEQERIATQGRLPSPVRDHELHAIDLKIASNKRLQTLLSNLGAKG